MISFLETENKVIAIFRDKEVAWKVKGGSWIIIGFAINENVNLFHESKTIASCLDQIYTEWTMLKNYLA